MDFRFHNCWDNHQGIMKRVIFWAVVFFWDWSWQPQDKSKTTSEIWKESKFPPYLNTTFCIWILFLGGKKSKFWDYKYTLDQWQKDKSQRRICCSREYSSAGAACAIAMPATAPSCRQLGQAAPGQPSWWGVPQTCYAEFVSQSQNNWATTFYLNLLLVTANDLKASLHLWDCFKCTDTNLAIK